MLQVSESKVVKSVLWHLVPVFFLAALLCYCDRANLAFASTQIQQDLHLTTAQYGAGAGILFLGYSTWVMGLISMPVQTANLVLKDDVFDTVLLVLEHCRQACSTCLHCVLQHADSQQLHPVEGGCQALAVLRHHCLGLHCSGLSSPARFSPVHGAEGSAGRCRGRHLPRYVARRAVPMSDAFHCAWWPVHTHQAPGNSALHLQLAGSFCAEYIQLQAGRLSLWPA